MKRMLVNAAHPEEVRVAFIDGQELYDLDIESRGKKQRLEDIYKASVIEVLPNLSAAFIDYGQIKPGFLSLKHVKAAPEDAEISGDPKISLEKGQEVLVQVVKDERDRKGAQLTTDILLKSQHLILHPCSPAPRSSGYLHAASRKMLAETKKELSIPVGMDVAIKSESIQVTPKGLQKEIDWLLQIWKNIIQANESKDYPAPRLLYQREPSPTRVLRDYLATPVDEIIVDTPEIFADFSELIDWCLPEYQGKLKLHKGPYSLFKEYKVNHQAEQGLDRTIKLKSGGTIVIDPTEALTAIDVNSARDKGETLKTNIEAVDEIARQLRIRDISGLVVIDLIGSSDKENSDDVEKIYKRMEKNLFYDRALTRIEKISRFGLLEIERQRLRISLIDTIANICPNCQGRGSVVNIEHAALQVIYEIEDNIIKKSVDKINIVISPKITSYIFNNKRSKISYIEKNYNVTINIISNAAIQDDYFELRGFNNHNLPVFTLNSRKIKKHVSPGRTKNKNPVVKPHKKPKIGFFSKLFSKLFKSNNKILVKKNNPKNNNKKYSNNLQKTQQKAQQKNKYIKGTEQKNNNSTCKNKNKSDDNKKNTAKNKYQPPRPLTSSKQSAQTSPAKQPDVPNRQQSHISTGKPHKVSKVSTGEHASIDLVGNTGKNYDSINALPNTSRQQEPGKPQQIASNASNNKPGAPAYKSKAPMPSTSSDQPEVLVNKTVVPEASKNETEALTNQSMALNDPRTRDKSTLDT